MMHTSVHVHRRVHSHTQTWHQAGTRSGRQVRQAGEAEEAGRQAEQAEQAGTRRGFVRVLLTHARMRMRARTHADQTGLHVCVIDDGPVAKLDL